MISREDAANQTVRVKVKDANRLGLFVCSSIAVGAGMAGEFLDDGQGAVVPLANMIEVVDKVKAVQEARQWKEEKNKARIKEVVKSVENSQEEFSGTIILHVGFSGSLPKTKALTKEERKIFSDWAEKLIARETDEDRIKAIKQMLSSNMKHGKTLFTSDEYDAIEGFKQKRRQEFANLGIPFPLGDSMYLIRIANIPKAEELAAKTERELQAVVERFSEVYPSQITKEVVDLGPLYNAGDYKAPEAIPGLFKFKTKWMHFGTPEILKEIDAVMWERERARTAAVWQEAKAQGLILLRETMAEMVKRLVDAVTPDSEGKKKRFYATAVTNLTDFFEAFEDRNMAGDEELAAQVAKLKELVEGKDIDAFKTDDKLRAFVKNEGSKIQESLVSMLVQSGARAITFDD